MRQPFDLVEHRRVGLVVVRAIDAARADDPQGRAALLHRADLHRRCMGPEHVRRPVVALLARHVERVHLRPRRMVAGDVQRVEIVPVGVDPRPFGDGKPHLGKDRGHFLGHLAHRVDRALPPVARGQRHVEPFGAQTFVQRGIGQGCLLRRQRRIDLVLQRIERGSGGLAFLGRHLAQLAHLQADLALLADGLHAQILQRRLVGRARDPIQILVAQVVHRHTLPSSALVLPCTMRRHQDVIARAIGAPRGGSAPAAPAEQPPEVFPDPKKREFGLRIPAHRR